MDEEETEKQWVKETHPLIIKMKGLSKDIENMSLEDIQYNRKEISHEINILIEKCSDLFSVASVLNKGFSSLADRIRNPKPFISKVVGQTLARERRVLEVLNINPGGLTRKAIAEKLNVDRQFIDSTVSKLCKENVITVKDVVPTYSKTGGKDKGHPSKRYILNSEEVNVRL